MCQTLWWTQTIWTTQSVVVGCKCTVQLNNNNECFAGGIPLKFSSVIFIRFLIHLQCLRFTIVMQWKMYTKNLIHDSQPSNIAAATTTTITNIWFVYCSELAQYAFASDDRHYIAFDLNWRAGCWFAFNADQQNNCNKAFNSAIIHLCLNPVWICSTHAFEHHCCVYVWFHTYIIITMFEIWH